MIQQLESLPPSLDLDETPTEEELETVIGKMKLRKAGGKMKLRKAGGKTGIVPELVLFGGGVMWDRLLELMKVMWQSDVGQAAGADEGDVAECCGTGCWS